MKPPKYEWVKIGNDYVRQLSFFGKFNGNIPHEPEIKNDNVLDIKKLS